MVNIINYLNKNFIKEIEKTEIIFFEDPTRFADMVYTLSESLRELGVNIIKEYLEDLNECLKKSSNVSKTGLLKSMIRRNL